MRRSKKSEFKKGIFRGLCRVFFSCTYLPTLASAEARKYIAIKAANEAAAAWDKYRITCDTLEKAAECGEWYGERHGWESDAEVNKVAEMATLATHKGMKKESKSKK